MTNECKAEFYEDSSIACDCATGECPRIKFKLNPEDLVIEVLPESPLGFIIKPPKAVRITHTPTGISYTSSNKQSQHANKAAALEGLELLVKAYKKNNITTTERKHTQGPWMVVTEGVSSPKVVDAAGLGICHTTYAPTNAKANARLIAASPELLAALEYAYACLTNQLSTATKREYAIDQARVAIAKATGVAYE